MRIAYFDCFSGASGDMILGALMDAGLDPDTLSSELARLHLEPFAISAETVVKNGIGGTRAVIEVRGTHPHCGDHHDIPHRRLSDIRRLIQSSSLKSEIKTRAMDIFTRLAEAEAHIHRTEIEQIHFHEVGAMDAIIDIVGAVIGLDILGIEQIVCSPINVGRGTVECAHGTLPVPAPATLELMKHRPIYATDISKELLTPTGAAILTTLATHFGPLPQMIVQKTGYGAGMADLPIPNLLRMIIGDSPDSEADFDTDQVAVITTNIDDMDPRLYDGLFDTLLSNGAVDVLLTPVHMKKNRPAIEMSVLCPPDHIHAMAQLLIQHTTTIGLRWHIEHRIKSPRHISTIDTIHGPVRIKVAGPPGHYTNVSVEYDDCKRIAMEKNIPVKTVMAEAMAAVFSEKNRK